MKIILKPLLLMGILVCSLTNVFAHAFWIKTNSTGKKGQPHELEIFFAEPADKPELLDSKEMASVKGFSVWLLAPGKDKIRLETVAANDRYKATFTPEEEGQYYVILQNDQVAVLDFPSVGPFKAEFYASAVINVGNGEGLNTWKNEDFKLNVFAIGTSSDKPVFLEVKKQVDIAKVTISIFGQGGWKLDLKPDDNGKVQFRAPKKGVYFVEAVYEDKTTGSFKDKAYRSVYYAATNILELPN